jgi:hypothetical protein
MQQTPQGQTPPGWYPDGRGAVRWWDGNRWTGHVQPRPPVAVVPVAQPLPKRYVTRGVSGTEHLIHLVLTVATCGLWLIVWLIRMFAGRHRAVAKY